MSKIRLINQIQTICKVDIPDNLKVLSKILDSQYVFETFL